MNTPLLPSRPPPAFRLTWQSNSVENREEKKLNSPGRTLESPRRPDRIPGLGRQRSKQSFRIFRENIFFPAWQHVSNPVYVKLSRVCTHEGPASSRLSRSVSCRRSALRLPRATAWRCRSVSTVVVILTSCRIRSCTSVSAHTDAVSHHSKDVLTCLNCWRLLQLPAYGEGEVVEVPLPAVLAVLQLLLQPRQPRRLLTVLLHSRTRLDSAPCLLTCLRRSISRPCSCRMVRSRSTCPLQSNTETQL